jgi:hypothetical protein
MNLKKGGQTRKFSQCNFSKKNHRGQMQISFGMIFSIILIIVFLAFGFYAIKKFLDLQSSVQIDQFMQDFQNDVDKAWKSPEVSRSVKYTLPTSISSVCFKNDEFENLQFTANNIVRGTIIEHLDILNITAEENPFCIENTDGKVSFTIVKNFGENLVRITR